MVQIFRINIKKCEFMNKLLIMSLVSLVLLSCGGPESSPELNDIINNNSGTQSNPPKLSVKRFECNSSGCPKNAVLIRSSEVSDTRSSCSGFFIDDQKVMLTKSCLKSLELNKQSCDSKMTITDLDGGEYSCEKLYVSKSIREGDLPQYSQIIIETNKVKPDFVPNNFELARMDSSSSLSVWFIKFDSKTKRNYQLVRNDYCKLSENNLRTFSVNQQYQSRTSVIKNCSLQNLELGSLVSNSSGDIFGSVYRKLKEDTRLNVLLGKKPKSLFLMNTAACLLKNSKNLIPEYNHSDVTAFDSEMIINCDREIKFPKKLDEENFYLKKLFNIEGSTRRVYFLRGDKTDDVSFFEVRYPACLNSRKETIPYYKLILEPNEFFEVDTPKKSIAFDQAKYRLMSIYDRKTQGFRISFVVDDNIVETVHIRKCR